MVVCKYFMQGNCRFGANCRNEHPGASRGVLGDQNRFGALSGNTRYGGGGGGGGGGNARRDVWQFNPDEVPNDLGAGKGRPKWILSSYSPGRNAPASLLEGNEFSPEEIRTRFYELAAQNKENEADQEAIALWQKAEQDMNQIVNNARDIEKFILEAEKKHPNREDFTHFDGTKPRDQFVKDLESSSNMSGGFGSGSGGGFGQTSSSNTFGSKPASTFGQTATSSGFGSSPFSKPAFGQTGFGGASPSGGGFGQATSGGGFGAGSSSGTFGKPAFGQAGFGQSTFGQAAQPSSTFGQPSQPASTFGQPSQPTSTFGQPSQPTSGFGQPSQPSSGFGQPSQPSSGFGQPAFGSSGFGQNATKNPFAPASAAGGFGQPSQPTSTFGQPSQPSSAFGQPSQPSSTFGQTSQPSSTFGQPSQPSSTFGQTSQPSQPSPFGQPSAFGKPAGAGQTTFGSSPFAQPAPANPFSRPLGETQSKEENMDTATPSTSRPQSRANPFGNPTSGATNQPFDQPPPTAATSTPIINTSTTPHPLTSRPPHALHYTQSLPLTAPQKNPQTGQLTLYRGQRVEYVNGVPCYRRPDNRQLEKIWFPDAGATPDVVALNREDKVGDCEGEKSEYTEDVVAQYKHLFETGSWRGGKMPLVPPLREWAVYDF